MKRRTREADRWKGLLAAITTTIIFLQNSEASASQVLPTTASPTSSSSVSSSGSSAASDINHSLGEEIPARILAEIRSRDDHLQCFPKLLCTIYQGNSISRQGFLNVTELAVAYAKLQRAVHYKSPTAAQSTKATIGQEIPSNVKRPVIQLFELPTGILTSISYQGRKDQYFEPHLDLLQDYNNYDPRSHVLPAHNRRFYKNPYDYDDYPEEEYSNKPRRSWKDEDSDEKDDREYFREKLKMSQMMKDMMAEDKAELQSEENRARGSLPTSSLLSSMFPFGGLRSGKRLSTDPAKRSPTADKSGKMRTNPNSRSSQQRRRQHNYRVGDSQQSPFWKAVSSWQRLRKRSHCGRMYKQCPFEGWEMVRMLDLVKDQSKILSAYLRLTVDDAKSPTTRM